MSRVILISLALLFWAPALQAESKELSIQLPAVNTKSNLIRDAVLHLLEGMYESDKALPAVTQDLLLLEKARLPEPFLKALERVAEPIPAAKIYTLFKRTNEHFKAVAESYRDRSLQYRHQDFPLPRRLQELEEKTQFNHPEKHWEREIIEKSEVKGLTRVLYRSPKGTPRVSIAQTHLSETGDLGAKVRETEVIVKRSDSPQWDFYAYDEAGNLAIESTFVVGENKDAVTGPVPLLCFTCHYQAEKNLFINRHFLSNK